MSDERKRGELEVAYDKATGFGTHSGTEKNPDLSDVMELEAIIAKTAVEFELDARELLEGINGFIRSAQVDLAVTIPEDQRAEYALSLASFVLVNTLKSLLAGIYLQRGREKPEAEDDLPPLSADDLNKAVKSAVAMGRATDPDALKEFTEGCDYTVGGHENSTPLLPQDVMAWGVAVGAVAARAQMEAGDAS